MPGGWMTARAAVGSAQGTRQTELNVTLGASTCTIFLRFWRMGAATSVEDRIPECV